MCPKDNVLSEMVWNCDYPEPVSKEKKYMRLSCLGNGSCLLHAVYKAFDRVYQRSYSIERKKKWECLKHIIEDVPDGLCDNGYKEFLYAWRRKYIHHQREKLADKLECKESPLREMVRNTLPGLFTCVYEGYPAECGKGPKEYPAVDRKKSEEEQKRQESELDDMVFDSMILELRSRTSLPYYYVPILASVLDDGQPKANVFIVRGMALANKPKYDHGRNVFGEILYGKDVHSTVVNNPDRRAVVVLNINDNHFELIVGVDDANKIAYSLDNSEPLIQLFHSILDKLRES